ncbi:MAG TPA: DUF6702 family protein [Woeseiaceae bacterium]|nr:DUF6702 family protein [Woeseiaceae bacterium]
MPNAPAVLALRAALALCAVLAAAGVQAHRAKGSLTTVEFNDSTGRVEIVHRLHRHDAELGVGSIIGEPALSLEALRSQARVALYVAERFHIAANGEELELAVVGAEPAGDYLLVYQEHAGPLPRHIEIRDDILRDAFPAQINQVNITDGDAVHSLIFTGDALWRGFTFADTSDARQQPG